ncbi:unnamed protein product, partial [Gulo gulo]
SPELEEGLGSAVLCQGSGWPGVPGTEGFLVGRGFWGVSEGWEPRKSRGVESPLLVSAPLSEAEGLGPASWPSVQGGAGSGLEPPAAPWGLLWLSRLSPRVSFTSGAREGRLCLCPLGCDVRVSQVPEGSQAGEMEQCGP